MILIQPVSSRMEKTMKTYEVVLHVEAVKSLFVEAEDEDAAMEAAFDICDKTVIPVVAEDLPDIYVEDVVEYIDGLSAEPKMLER